MVLGVDEACTNIIRHAYDLRDDQLIALSLEGLKRIACGCACAIIGKQTPSACDERPAA